MDIFLAAAVRAIRSLFIPGMFGVFILALVLTIAVLIGFAFGSSIFFDWFIYHIKFDWLTSDNESSYSYLFTIFSTFGSFMIVWMLFPGITPIIVNFFDNRIASLIEKHDYPNSMPARDPNFWKELFHNVRFSVMAVLLNILVLPLYLVPVLNLFLFYFLNGYLLGREYFVTAALRHMPRKKAEDLRRRYSRTVMTAGIALTFLATIPVVNLFAPFWGVAMMVHLYHKLTSDSKIEILLPNQNL